MTPIALKRDSIRDLKKRIPEIIQKPWANPRTINSSDFESLLDYEMRNAARYRRFTTLVMVISASEVSDVYRLLLDVIRTSDEYFHNGESAAILMGETDSDGALSAINRYKSIIRDAVDLRFSVASYPKDAHDVFEMLTIAQRRLFHARVSGELGAVVWAG